MKRKYSYLITFLNLSFSIFLFNFNTAGAQDFLFQVTDNINTLENKIVYTLSNDSISVRGISPKGNESLLYHQKSVSRSDYRAFRKFLGKSGLKNLDPEIINEPNIDHSTGDFHGSVPRELLIKYSDRNKHKDVRIYNTWVHTVHTILEEFNFFVPEEVRIIYMKEDFDLILY